MLKIENTEVMGWEHAIRGMRNPKNSWEKSDSGVCATHGKITSKKVIHYDFISGISVGCKYHQNWTETYRSGEAIL